MVQEARILHYFNYVSSAGDTHSKTLNCVRDGPI